MASEGVKIKALESRPYPTEETSYLLHANRVISDNFNGNILQYCDFHGITSLEDRMYLLNMIRAIQEVL